MCISLSEESRIPGRCILSYLYTYFPQKYLWATRNLPPFETGHQSVYASRENLSGAPHNALLMYTEGKLPGLVSKRASPSLPDSWSLIRLVGMIHLSINKSPELRIQAAFLTCSRCQAVAEHLSCRAGCTTKTGGLGMRGAGWNLAA